MWALNESYPTPAALKWKVRGVAKVAVKVAKTDGQKGQHVSWNTREDMGRKLSRFETRLQLATSYFEGAFLPFTYSWYL